MAGSHGVEVLPDSYGITGADLKRCEESQGVNYPRKFGGADSYGFLQVLADRQLLDSPTKVPESISMGHGIWLSAK